MALINGEMVLINSIKTLKNLEVGGTSTLTGTVSVGASVTLTGFVVTANTFALINTNYGQIKTSTDDGLMIAIGPGAGSGNRHLIFTDANNRAVDHDHDALSQDPTIFLHSVRSPDESNTEWLSAAHDGSNAVNSVGFGGHTFTTAAQKARGTMTLTGFPAADESFVLNATTIIAKADGSGNIDWFTIGGTAAATVTNIVATLAECTEAANITAWDGAGDTVVIEWDTAGVAGNAIVFTEGLANCTIDGVDVLGGTHAGIAAATLLDVDEGGITTSLGAIRAATSVWYHHHEISAFSAAVGGSGATFVPGDGSTLGGYQLNADTEYLYTDSDVHSNWDAASDIFVDVTFDIRAADPGGGGNTVDLKLLCYIKGTGDVVTKTQTIENAVDIDSAAQWTQYTERFIIDYDAGGGNQVDAGDKISIRLNLETDTSEVDDVTINKFDFLYKTAKVAEEV